MKILNTNVCRIHDIDFKNYEVTVEYENIPKNLKRFFYENTITFDISNMIEYGKNKEELELKLATNKYNL